MRKILHDNMMLESQQRHIVQVLGSSKKTRKAPLTQRGSRNSSAPSYSSDA